MQLDIRHAIAVAIIVATLLIVGTVASLMQSDTPPGRAASQTCVPATPLRPIPTELMDFVLPQDCATPEG